MPLDLDVRLVRVRGGEELDVTGKVETISWEDDNSGGDGEASVVVSGSMTARRSRPLDPSSQPFLPGDRVAVLYRDAMAPAGAAWKEEIRLQVNSPDSEPDTGVVNFQVTNPFIAFENVEGVFVYRKDKHHPNPWYYDEIVKDACRKMGVPFREDMVKGLHPIDSVEGATIGSHKKKHVTREALTAFTNKVIGIEMRYTGRRLIQSVENGALTVKEMGASNRAFILDLTAQQLEVTTQVRVRPPTVIRARGHVGKGRSSKHLSREVVATLAAAKFGRIVQEHDFGRVKDEADLHRRATLLLARILRSKRTGTTTIQGLPGAQPYDAVVLARKPTPGVPAYQGYISPDEFGGPHGIVFISTRSHTIQAGIWTTQLSLQELDPWLTYRSKLAEHKLHGKKQKHKSPSKKAHEKPGSSPAASAHRTVPTSSTARPHSISHTRS